jgi:hypothetical protein
MVIRPGPALLHAAHPLWVFLHAQHKLKCSFDQTYGL